MGLFLKYAIPTGYSARAVFALKISGALRVLEAYKLYFGGDINIRAVYVWKDALSEALGGSLLFYVYNTGYEKEGYFSEGVGLRGDFRKFLKFVVSDKTVRKIGELVDNFYSLIVHALVDWRFGDEVIPLDLTVYNAPVWRRTYGDIILDFSHHFNNYDCLAEFILSEDKLKRGVGRFLSYIMDRSPLRVRRVVFGISADALSDLRYQLISYYRSEKEVLETILRTLGDLARRRELVNVPEDLLRYVSRIKPYRRRFLVNTIWSFKKTPELFEQYVSQAGFDIVRGQSIMLIAKKENSGEELFELLSKNLIFPAIKNIPDAQFIKDKILEALIKSFGE